VISYVPRPQFAEFHNRFQRWAVLNTHRRAGKTVAVVNDVVMGGLECRLHRPQFAYIGPTFTQAKRIAWQFLKDYAEPYLGKPPQEAELKVTLKNDATILVLGADNADAIRGMYLDGAIMDEYAMFRPSVFSTVVRPALSDRNGWGVFASTPKGKNLFWEKDKEAKKYPEEFYRLTLKASESGIISMSELAELRRDMDDEEFAQEYECSFDAAMKGAIYASEVNLMFFEGRTKCEYDPSLPVHVVYDLGFTDATVACWFQVHRDGRVCVVAVDATTGQDIFYHIQRIHQFPGEVGDVWLPHDARAKNLQTGKSIVEQFLSEGIRPRLVPNHKVRDRIAATRRELSRIWVSETHTGDLLEALKAYSRQWDDATMMFSDRPIHDWSSHYADSFGYMCMVLEPSMALLAKEKVESVDNQLHLENLFQDYEQRLSDRRIS
jgi:phage terminase large subunit